jgi:predicted XRE-type DNA-binding protein
MESIRLKNVWDALEDTPQDATNMKARSELMMAIRAVTDAWGLTQAQAAHRIGITQPRMNDLLQGKIDKFSLDALVVLAHSVGLSVELRIAKRAA